MPDLRIDPLGIADGEYLGRVREVRRDPFVVLAEAVVGKRQYARGMRRDYVRGDGDVAVAEQLNRGGNEAVRVAADRGVSP